MKTCQSYNKPIDNGTAKIIPNQAKSYTSAELLALIRHYTDFQDIIEREYLVEYVDIALDLIKSSNDKQSIITLANTLVEIGYRNILPIPLWVTDLLSDAIKDKAVSDTEKAIPLLTLALVKNDSSLEHKAQRIINRCYRACFDNPTADDFYI